MITTLLLAATLSFTPIDVIHVDMPVANRHAELAACWTRPAGAGIAANCDYGRTYSGADAPGPGPLIDFATIAPNFEWFVEVGGPCVLVEYEVGASGENRYTFNCGDVIWRAGFEP